MLALAGILVIAAVIWSGFLEDAAQENLADKDRAADRRGSAGESFADHPVDGSGAGESVHQLERRRRRAGGFATRRSHRRETAIHRRPGADLEKAITTGITWSLAG